MPVTQRERRRYGFAMEALALLPGGDTSGCLRSPCRIGDNVRGIGVNEVGVDDFYITNPRAQEGDRKALIGIEFLERHESCDKSTPCYSRHTQ
jgi:hypothetical protein